MRLALAALALVGCQLASPSSTRQALRAACEDTTCSEDDPPPDKPPLTNCDERATTQLDLAIVAAKMAKAATCLGVVPTNMNGYGCFCGSGNTGLNTKPADKLDACCQQHDIDWHGVCQNVPEQAGGTKGCNCYQNTPDAICDPAAHTLSLPAGLNACQQACGAELLKNSSCMADHKADWNQDLWQGKPFSQTPFAGDCPAYCKAGDPPPGSTFGPVKLPENQNYPTCKPVKPQEDAPRED